MITHHWSLKLPKGYNRSKDESNIPVMSLECERWHADVRKDEVLHQEVEQLE